MINKKLINIYISKIAINFLQLFNKNYINLRSRSNSLS